MGWLEISLLVLFAGAGFFFALAETALLTLGKWRLRQMYERKEVRAVFISKLLAEPADLLATITFGNTMAHGALIAAALTIGYHATTLGWMIGLLVVVLILVCEIAPKTLAVRRPERWAPRVAWLMAQLVQVTRPVRWVARQINALLLRLVPRAGQSLPELTDEEYQELLELACQQGTLALTEKEIILQILHLDSRTAGELMRPRSQMDSIPDDLTMPEMIDAARRFQHRRLPMFDETPDTIVGILNAPRLLANPDADLADLVEFPSFVPEDMNLLALLKNFQRQKQNMAIVLDEFGGTAGLVPLEDILADIVGAHRREAGAGEFVMEQTAPGRWRLSGSVWLQDFRREFPSLATVPGVDTIGGLVSSRMDEIPPIDTEVRFSGLRFRVTDADERRVKAVEVNVPGKT